MKAPEKYKLIIDPLREAFPKMNTVVRRNELWYVNRKCKFLLYISPTLSSSGYFIGVHVAVGSFYQGFCETPDGYPIIDRPFEYYAIHSVQDIVNLQSHDDLERYCIQQAEDIRRWLWKNVVQHILEIEDYCSYITAGERIRLWLHPTVVSAAAAWDYLGAFDRNRALAYLEEQLSKPVAGTIYGPEHEVCDQLKTMIGCMTDDELAEALRVRELQSIRGCQKLWSGRKWQLLD